MALTGDMSKMVRLSSGTGCALVCMPVQRGNCVCPRMPDKAQRGEEAHSLAEWPPVGAPFPPSQACCERWGRGLLPGGDASELSLDRQSRTLPRDNEGECSPVSGNRMLRPSPSFRAALVFREPEGTSRGGRPGKARAAETEAVSGLCRLTEALPTCTHPGAFLGLPCPARCVLAPLPQLPLNNGL